MTPDRERSADADGHETAVRLLAAYLAAMAVVLVVGALRGRGSFAGGLLAHLLLLGVVLTAAFVTAVPRALREWLPLLLLLFLYHEIPDLIAAVGAGAFHDPAVMRWERALLGGQPAHDLAHHAPWMLLSEALHVAYLSYYAIIFVPPALLYLAGEPRRRAFDEMVFSLTLCFVACFTWYVSFPVEGPRYVWGSPDAIPVGPVRAFTLGVLESGSARGTAFPSSHVAVAVTQSLLAVRYWSGRGAPVAVLTVGLAVGAVYGGFHYAVDVLVGAALGVAVGLTGPRIHSALLRRGQTTAMQPTNAPSSH